MKLLMTSGGFRNAAIVKAAVELVGKRKRKINFAVIAEAVKGEPGDHRWFIEDLERLADHFGGKIELVDLQAQNLDEVQKRLEIADVIYCEGGNTDYLMEVFKKTGFNKVLPKLLEDKVWVGTSAGSCVVAHKESEEFQQEVYREQRTVDKFLNLVPIEFLPHMNGEFYVLNRENAIAESRRTKLPVYALTDAAAIVVKTDAGGNLSYQMVGRGYTVAHNCAVLQDSKPAKFSVSVELRG